MDIKKTFDNEASEYDFTSRAVNIHFDEALDILVENIKTKKSKLRILDVCCGTGILTEKVAKRFPSAEFVGVDFSTGMLEIAKQRMKNYNFKTFVSDICDKDKMQQLGEYDLIITSLGIHNIHGFANKKIALQNIIAHLKSGGQYITFDYIKGKDEKEIKHFHDVQRKRLLETYNEQETQNWLDLLGEEDDPETLEDNFKLLENAGLKDYKLIWQKEFLAIWQAKK